MKVRQATPEDLPALVALFDELARLQRDWRVFTPRPGFYDEVKDKYKHAMESQDALLLVSEDGDEVVGMAYAEVRIPSRYSDEKALEISSVVVRDDHRGRGVGRILVGEAARFAGEHGVEWLEVKTFIPNETAMLFWRSLGFNPRVVQLTAPTPEVAERTGES